jgi:hypothetical protein
MLAEIDGVGVLIANVSSSIPLTPPPEVESAA